MFKPVIIIALCFSVIGCQTSSATPDEDTLPLQDTPTAPATLELSSPDFVDGGALDATHALAGFGCTGENIAPTLEWKNVPEGTESFALIVHDVDAPTGVGFFHWVVVDLPGDARELGSDSALPAEARALHTDFGTPGYGGPCPPEGRTHRYVFSLYALDVESLSVPPQATAALTRFMLSNHTLAYARITGTFRR